jgi:alpha-beta hydrolase superfamily lysophospholipase
VMKAWFVRPPQANGEAVVLLHGIADNRVSIAGFSEMFLRQGYSVLMPDSRDQGESGGKIATYGTLERDDVRRWVAWVRQSAPGCTYLLGESMGAAIGLETTAVTPQLCAVAVESPYADSTTVSYERLGWMTRLGTRFWRTVGWPVVPIATQYSRVVYRYYSPDVEPILAVRASKVPTLLIAGTADRAILMHHSQELEAACPGHCELWIVPGADHGGAATVEHEEFERRVLGWFAGHDVGN